MILDLERKMKNKTDLDIIKIYLSKYNIKYHELTENEYSFIEPFNIGDAEGFLNVEGFGLIPLEKSGQLLNFIEFRNGMIVSY